MTTSAAIKRGWVKRRAGLDARFWDRVDQSGGADSCWTWAGNRQTRDRRWNTGGYGVLKREGRIVFAHRRAYELAHGPIPAGDLVLHSCDNPPCCNPAHLRLGDKRANARDALERGRLGRGHWPTSTVLQARSSALPVEELANLIGCSATTVRRMKSGTYRAADGVA